MIGRIVRWTTAMVAGAVVAVVPGTAGWADWSQDNQWHLAFLNVPAANAITQGEGVTVGVVDTGVDGTHPDLAGTLQPGADLIAKFDAGNAQLDTVGHGTALAGLIGAHGTARGIAPKATILPVKAGVDRLTRGVEGITWAMDHGAKVICFAGGEGLPSDRWTALVQSVLARDVVLVAAAGNIPDERKVLYPAASPGVVAAAAVDRNGEHAAISVTGPELVLSAPTDVGTTYPGKRYAKQGGTSAATAIIAGVAALVRAKYPNLSAQEVIHRMTATATDKGKPGRDDEYGYGIVNPVAALTADVKPEPSGSPSASGAPPAGGEGGRTGMVVGIAAGAGGLLLVAVITTWLVRRRRRSAGYDDWADEPGPPPVAHPAPQHPYGGYGPPPYQPGPPQQQQPYPPQAYPQYPPGGQPPPV